MMRNKSNTFIYGSVPERINLNAQVTQLHTNASNNTLVGLLLAITQKHFLL